MTRHLGVSVFFSVAIVVFFAVVLYQPEDPAAPPGAPVAERTAPEAVAPADAAAAEPPPAPTADSRATELLPAPPVVRTLPVARRAAPALARAEIGQTVKPGRPRPSAPAAKVKPRALAPSKRLAFIEADAGETVADVALRVYGSSEAAGALWMANRDILPDRDAHLSAGTVLRSP